jgi:hypothetical protein
MYGMPQPGNYGQYGFGSYGGFPNQAAGAAAGPAPTTLQGNAAGAGLGLTAGPDASTNQASQQQWAGADPNSYYSNYWSGEACQSMFLGLISLLCFVLQDIIVVSNKVLKVRGLRRPVTNLVKNYAKVSSGFVADDVSLSLSPFFFPFFSCSPHFLFHSPAFVHHFPDSNPLLFCSMAHVSSYPRSTLPAVQVIRSFVRFGFTYHCVMGPA